MPYSLACVQVIIPNMAVFDCLESSFKDNNITLSDCLTNTQIKSWCVIVSLKIKIIALASLYIALFMER